MYTYRRIEQATTYSVKRPNVDQQTEAVDQCGENICLTATRTVWARVRSLCGEHDLARKGEVQEEECADEFSSCGDKVGLKGARMEFAILTLSSVAVRLCFWLTVDRETRHCVFITHIIAV